jgi:hypothetical protein
LTRTALHIAFTFAAITALLESWNVGSAGSFPHHLAIWALGGGGIALFWMGGQEKQRHTVAFFLFLFALTLRLVTYWYILEQFKAGLFDVIERNLMLILNTAILFFEIAVFMVDDGRESDQIKLLEARMSDERRKIEKAHREEIEALKAKPAPKAPAKVQEVSGDLETVLQMRAEGKAWKEIIEAVGGNTRTWQRKIKELETQ